MPPLPENVWPNGQSMAYAIERFDRRPGGRIHMEDLAQVKGVYPHNKYEGSFETAAALVYRGMDFESGLEFVRRLFFSFMVGNGDMHLKNTTLLYSDPRRPTISPAYDLVCTAPYQYPDDEDLGLKLGGSRRFEAVSLNSFKFLCDRIGMPSSEVLVEINRMATEFPEKFAESEHLWSQLPDHQKWLKSRIGRLSPLFDC